MPEKFTSVPSTTSPISLPSDSERSLPQQIHASSRLTHSELNRLIIARLPLALPPNTTEPSTYLSGLLHIVPIYQTFESLWASCLETPYLSITFEEYHVSNALNSGKSSLDAQPAPMNQSNSNGPLKLPSKVSARIQALLAHLRLPGLLRSGRLRADIQGIFSMSEQKFDEQVEKVSRIGKIAEFTTHAQQSIKANPHVIIAYAWVLYMALFSGGRFIRKSLQTAGQEFWMSPVHQNVNKNRLHFRSDLSISGIEFFNFDGNQDGEDLKLEFKRRIAEAEILLTDEEKRNIVQESRQIFEYMVEIVPELDDICGPLSCTAGLENVTAKIA